MCIDFELKFIQVFRLGGASYSKYVMLALCMLSVLSIKAQTIVHQENFNAGLGSWHAVDISDNSDVWYATGGYAQINGFGGGNDEDWLISPFLNLNAQADEYLLFDYLDGYNGAFLEVYYSTNYSGAGNSAAVNSATWHTMQLELIDIYATSCQSTLFQRHPALSLSGINGTAVSIAFKYSGLSSSSKQYRLDNIQVLSGYYDNIEALIASGYDCEDLKTSLSAEVADQSDRIRYTSSLYDVWDAFLHTDDRPNDSGSNEVVWDMFTDMPGNTGEYEFDHCANRDNGSCPGGEGICYNREHTLPKSWWGGGTALADTQNVDLHHLVPSDRSLNGYKSNYGMGEVLNPTTIGSNGVRIGFNNTYPCSTTRYFEPIDEFKGDYARMFFYMATRYEHIIAGWEPINTEGDCALSGDSYTAYEPWFHAMLSEWHLNDPVSQKEIDRNNAVYAIQGNRNPFIDHPEYATMIWGDYLGNPCGMAPLPIELLSFQAKWAIDGVALDWVTASEIDNSHFVIERSSDAVTWDPTIELLGAGNSSGQLSYSAVDKYPLEGQSYYRLKQVDFNGDFSYSDIRAVQSDSHEFYDLMAYPTPTRDYLTILARGTSIAARDIQVFSMEGQSCNALIALELQSDNRAQLDLQRLKKGLYIVRVGGQSLRIEKL